MGFWEGLNLAGKIYFCIGIAATVFLVLQIITMLFGLGNAGDVDVDLSGDGEPDVTIDTGDGFNLFTVRGIVAFFAIGGWTGFALAGVNVALSIVCSFVAGTLALVVMAFIMKGVMKMRSDGNISIDKSIGKNAIVYLTIPSRGNGFGKITLTLEERYVELNAITEDENEIPTGAQVTITGIRGDTVIVTQL